MPTPNNSYKNYYYKPGSSSGSNAELSPRPPKHKHWFKKLIALVILLAIVVVAYGLMNGKSTTKLYDPKPPAIAKSNPVVTPAVSSVPDANIATMTSAINTVISQNSDIDLSVSLIDLNNNQTENYGDSGAFTAASTTKVITAVDFLHEVELGQKSLNETVNGNTAENEIQQMIVISDDDAWDDLNELLGYSQVQSYANSIGVSSFRSVANTVSASDMAMLLQKLYEGKLLNSSNTELLLSYMKQANYRQYIVPAVPSSDTVYHKIGLYEDNVNDEAIIVNGDKAFVIVVFTNGNGIYNWTARAQMMQQITQAALAGYFD